jgi:hypothetical protein
MTTKLLPPHRPAKPKKHSPPPARRCRKCGKAEPHRGPAQAKLSPSGLCPFCLEQRSRAMIQEPPAWSRPRPHGPSAAADPAISPAYRRLAQDAMTVQDASNLSGVLHSFADGVVKVLRPEMELRHQDGYWINHHPISQLFTDKLASLSGMPGDSHRYFSQAWDACTAIAADPTADAAYRKFARDAMQVQDAINLSGILLSFSRGVSQVLWPESDRRHAGTDWINQHPIVRLFVSKLQSITIMQYDIMEQFSRAWSACEALAAGRDVF